MKIHYWLLIGLFCVEASGIEEEKKASLVGNFATSVKNMFREKESLSEQDKNKKAVEERIENFKECGDLKTIFSFLGSLEEFPQKLLEIGIRVKHLALLSTFFSALPPNFGVYFCNLEKLDLSGNLLREDLPSLPPHLVSLNLSSNLFNNIPQSVCSLCELKEFDISNNPLNPASATAFTRGYPNVKLVYLPTRIVRIGD